jgi:hypothetical protein
MKRTPFLSTTQVASAFKEMVSCRRLNFGDNEYFRMTDVWRDLSDEEGRWSVKAYQSKETEDYKRKAGVIAFADRVTLIVDEKLWANADRGCKLSNFILAHELGHVALDHHARSMVIKNFQLFAGPSGMSNLPPTPEELEANLAAVFFQCGVALMDPKLDPVQLAHRAFSDVYYVKKAQRIVQLEVFQRELQKLKTNYPRVVL